MSIELLKEHHKVFIINSHVELSNPYARAIVGIFGYLESLNCEAEPCAKKPKETIPEGFVTVYEFEEKTMICSAKWIPRYLKDFDESFCVKVKSHWYVHPERIVEKLANSKKIPKIARRAKMYLKNHSDK